MTTKYCLVLLFGVVLFSTASVLADHHDPPKHENKPPTYHDKPPKGEKPPPKHKPPTLLDNEDKKPFPEHKPPTHGREEPPKGKGKGDKPPPHDHHPGRLLLESKSLDEQNSPNLKPVPEHKPPTHGREEPPKGKGKGEKPPPEHKPPHGDHPAVEDVEDSHKAPRKLKPPTVEKKPPTHSHKPPHKPPHAN